MFTDRKALEVLARDGILPFEAYVERKEEGRWVRVASGTSVAWLIAAADDESDFGRVRIVSQFGGVLAGYCF